MVFLIFFQNNKYHLVSKSYRRPDTILLTLDNIYQFKQNNGSALVFDSDSSFYFLRTHPKGKLSRKQKIKNEKINFQPFIIKEIGNQDFAIIIPSRIQGGDRTLIFRGEEDELIQDLIKFIEENKKR